MKVANGESGGINSFGSINLLRCNSENADEIKVRTPEIVGN